MDNLPLTTSYAWALLGHTEHPKEFEDQGEIETLWICYIVERQKEGITHRHFSHIQGAKQYLLSKQATKQVRE